MAHALHGRSFLKELDFTHDEWSSLLDLAAKLKDDKRRRRESQHLVGKNLALIFQKTSTRTRSAFEVGAYDQGAHVTFLDPVHSQFGHKESVADSARVLGRIYDGIEFRGSLQSDVETLAAQSGVPVWNGLTDEWHPTQMLADQLTMIEHTGKPINEISYAYLGDARCNTGNSLLVSGAMMGMDVRIVSPAELQPSESVQQAARDRAAESGARLTITDDVAAGVKGVDFVYTDIWVSMGEPEDVWARRIDLLRPYQVNAALMSATGNPRTKFMHCLPAYHDRRTTIGERIFRDFGLDGVEVTDEVFESDASIVFDEAENRLHTIKAVMVATLGQ